ncbi:MAG: hypothetical protein QOG34_639 [Frankiaceae bacterium]|nr:hypothetical protein [Frankiaceae bacterium]
MPQSVFDHRIRNFCNGSTSRVCIVTTRDRLKDAVMGRDLLLLVVGFLLTTVLGGILGTVLQQRAWKHQNDVRLREDELQRASELAGAIRKLLDKRLYRMLRLFFAVRARSQGNGTDESVHTALEDYNSVLYEWNDSLNANLAAVGASFGEAGRGWLETQVIAGFQATGARLEAAYRAVMNDTSAEEALRGLAHDLNALNDVVYRLGVFMMTQLRSGHVGRDAPSAMQRENSPADFAGRGVPVAGLED